MSNYERKVGDPKARICTGCGEVRRILEWADLVVCPDCDEPALMMSLATRTP